jgi:hypothetical protein
MTPSIGRIVLYCTSDGFTIPAIIRRVNEDGTVDLTAFGTTGTFEASGISEDSAGDGTPTPRATWRWMEYQKAVAAGEIAPTKHADKGSFFAENGRRKGQDFESNDEVPGVTFGRALAALKVGGRVAREGWNGKGMFLFLVPGSHFTVNRPPLLGIYAEGTGIDYRSHIDMKTAQGDVVPWVASQSDLLAEDWILDVSVI